MADQFDKFHAALNQTKNQSHASGDASGFGLSEEARIRQAISTPPQVKDEPAQEYQAPSVTVDQK